MVKEKINLSGFRGILRELGGVFFSAFLLVISAGTLQWVRGWIFIGLIASYQIVYILILSIVNPHLLNERGTLKWSETKLHDKYFVIFYVLFSYGIVMLAGLDVVRFRYSSVPLFTIWPGIIQFAGFAVFALWAYQSNASFVLTQQKENSTVSKQICTTGPYHYIRHPGYLSAIGVLLSYPLLLGSLLSIIPIFFCLILLVLRTYYEDKALTAESTEYAHYATFTPYRLLPHVW